MKPLHIKLINVNTRIVNKIRGLDCCIIQTCMWTYGEVCLPKWFSPFFCHSSAQSSVSFSCTELRRVAISNNCLQFQIVSVKLTSITLISKMSTTSFTYNRKSNRPTTDSWERHWDLFAFTILPLTVSLLVRFTFLMWQRDSWEALFGDYLCSIICSIIFLDFFLNFSPYRQTLYQSKI